MRSPGNILRIGREPVFSGWRTGGTVIGSIAVWSHDPTNYWPRADLASYVRDLMVIPNSVIEGIGALMLGWAERFLGRQRTQPGQARLRGRRTSGFAAITRRPATATS